MPSHSSTGHIEPADADVLCLKYLALTGTPRSGAQNRHVNYSTFTASLQFPLMAGIDDVRHTISTAGPESFPTFNWLNTRDPWGPLTTPWSPPSSCSTSWALRSLGADVHVTPVVPSDCMPGGSRIHSPGTCYGDYHIVQVIEWRTSDWTSGGSRVFGVACCER